MFKLGDIALLREVALELIHDLDEDIKDWCCLVPADPVEFFVDVEEDAPGGNGACLA